jgi:hypothetical protein
MRNDATSLFIVTELTNRSSTEFAFVREALNALDQAGDFEEIP